mmetsp:Transcript_11447/g.36352  ORF Transcript_11447/g.36352 Transcript_11447/m.36352 type:complete len:85 (+) Transcript_11447:1251-1505(+)
MYLDATYLCNACLKKQSICVVIRQQRIASHRERVPHTSFVMDIEHRIHQLQHSILVVFRVCYSTSTCITRLVTPRKYSVSFLYF